MNRSENKLFGHMQPGATMFHASLQGAGGVIPTIPTTVFSSTSSILYQPASVNYASAVAGDIVRSGVGVYTFKLKEGFPIIFDILPKVWGTDGKQIQMTDYNPSTRIASFKTFTSAGLAVDLATTDTAKFTIIGSNDIPVY